MNKYLVACLLYSITILGTTDSLIDQMNHAMVAGDVEKLKNCSEKFEAQANKQECITVYKDLLAQAYTIDKENKFSWYDNAVDRSYFSLAAPLALVSLYSACCSGHQENARPELIISWILLSCVGSYLAFDGLYCSKQKRALHSIINYLESHVARYQAVKELNS